MEDGDGMVCCRCNVPLTPAKADFTYLKHQFSADVPRCPQCGMTYVSEELVLKKMAPVEKLVEEK